MNEPQKQNSSENIAQENGGSSVIKDILKQKARELGETAAEEAQPDAQAVEIASLKDKVLRTMAEMENLRRRTENEKQDAQKYAVSNFAREMISVLENLQRASESIAVLDQNDDKIKSVLEGVELTRRELVNVFEKFGIRRIEPLGEPFDHNFHQAMLQVADPTKTPGTVAQVMQAGYAIHDRLLRPALVSVVKNGE